jgi:hypothetical protein
LVYDAKIFEGYGDMIVDMNITVKKIKSDNYWWWSIQERFCHR